MNLTYPPVVINICDGVKLKFFIVCFALIAADISGEIPQNGEVLHGASIVSLRPKIWMDRADWATNLVYNNTIDQERRHFASSGDALLLEVLARSRPCVIVRMSDIVEFNPRIFHKQANICVSVQLRDWKGASYGWVAGGTRLTVQLRRGPFYQCPGSEGWGWF